MLCRCSVECQHSIENTLLEKVATVGLCIGRLRDRDSLAGVHCNGQCFVIVFFNISVISC